MLLNVDEFGYLQPNFSEHLPVVRGVDGGEGVLVIAEELLEQPAAADRPAEVVDEDFLADAELQDGDPVVCLGVLDVKANNLVAQHRQVFLKLVDADGGPVGVISVPDREFHPKVGIDGVIMDDLPILCHRRGVFLQRQGGGVVGKACDACMRRKMMVWR